MQQGKKECETPDSQRHVRSQKDELNDEEGNACQIDGEQDVAFLAILQRREGQQGIAQDHGQKYAEQRHLS